MNGVKYDDIRAIVEFMYKGEVKVINFANSRMGETIGRLNSFMVKIVNCETTTLLSAVCLQRGEGIILRSGHGHP